MEFSESILHQTKFNEATYLILNIKSLDNYYTLYTKFLLK